MRARLPYAWEKSYPAGMRWDVPIATSTVQELLDRAVAEYADRPALAATSSPLGGQSKPGAIGLPLPGIVVEVVALDDPRRVLGIGKVGGLRIKGANVMRRYWNRPAETLPPLGRLRDFLLDKLGRHEMPAALEIRDALPRTGVGKLSKKELIEEKQSKHPP